VPPGAPGRCSPPKGVEGEASGGMDSPSSRQIYLTFPAESSFSEEDVALHFGSATNPPRRHCLPHQTCLTAQPFPWRPRWCSCWRRAETPVVFCPVVRAGCLGQCTTCASPHQQKRMFGFVHPLRARSPCGPF